MSKAKYKHNNFSSGQYDREFTGQESPIHSTGMSYCCNVLSSVQGELKSRPGTEWKADLTAPSVIIPFRRESSDLALVFASETLDIMEFDADGNLIPFLQGVYSKMVWNNTANNTPSSTAVSITGVTGNTNNFYKAFTNTVSNLISNYTNNRFFVPATSAFPVTEFNMYFAGGKVPGYFTMLIMPADGDFSNTNLKKPITWVKNAVVQYSEDGSSWTTQRLAKPWKITRGYREETSYGLRMFCGITFQPSNIESHPHWRIVITWDRGNILNNAPILVSFYDKFMTETRVQAQTLNSPYTTDNLKNIKYTQQNNEMYLTDGVHNTWKFSMTGATPTFQSSVTFSEGVPSCVRFFQNRLWFGGFASYPNRVRGSRFDSYNDFTVVTTNTKATDPILSDGNQITERITDLWGGFNVLYAQSPDGISFIESADDAVAPTRMNFTLKSHERASGITPTMKENIMFYVGLDKQSIYAFAYDNNLQQFVAPNISEHWQEVLKDKVSEIHFVPTRNDNIIGLLENGKMFSFLYNQQGGLGYFPVDVGGEVYDISVLKHNDDIDAYITVNRNNNWTIEKYHHPGFMQRTDAFLQSTQERNIATKENLLKTPYFDSWKYLKNEVIEEWEYNEENGTIAPQLDDTSTTDLTPYLGKVIRLYYGDNITDYISAEITDAHTEERTIEKEIQVIVNQHYYGWSYIGNTITVSPASPYTTSGTFTRSPSEDYPAPTPYYPYAWRQGNKLMWTVHENPQIGEGLFALGEDYVRPTRSFKEAVITAKSGGDMLTRTTTLSTGMKIYGLDYSEIGTASSVDITNVTITFNGHVYSRNTELDTSRPETHTETITVVVYGGSYSVDILDGPIGKMLFKKIQLPIESITTTEKIQAQDNGVYLGEFEPTSGTVELPNPAYNIQYGIPYKKIGVITELTNKGYLKEWGTIAVSLIDTMDLQIGHSMKTLEQLIEFNPNTDFYNSNPIMYNGIKLKNIADTDAYEKTLILYSEKGLPFCINGLESEIIIADNGGN